MGNPENPRSRSNSQRQRQNCRELKSRLRPQPPGRVTMILPDRPQPETAHPKPLRLDPIAHSAFQVCQEKPMKAKPTRAGRARQALVLKGTPGGGKIVQNFNVRISETAGPMSIGPAVSNQELFSVGSSLLELNSAVRRGDGQWQTAPIPGALKPPSCQRYSTSAASRFLRSA
jgi:hypothetical protein